MGFLKNLFKKKKTEEEYEEESGWDRVTEKREELDFKDPAVREQYVLNCLEEMSEASKELDRFNGEYNQVTSYLTDMEEIESLPKNEKKELEDMARHIHDLRKAHDEYVLTPTVISEKDYKHVETMFEEIESGISKMEEAEDMRDKIRQDLKRIDKERHAYDIRRRETETAIENARGVSTIAMIAAGILMVILLTLQLALGLDVVLGYYITIAMLAIAITITYVRYTDQVSEKKKVDSTINELILLENKVKIRYVNNRNLLDYLYTKYSVSQSSELRDLYDKYLEEKEAKRKFERNEAVYEEELSAIVRLLKRYPINYPEIWIHQTDALYDPREMVEIRHSLIGRRQKLRKQMEYNEQIALEASDEIKGIIRDYPQYADSVMALVNSYEKEN